MTEKEFLNFLAMKLKICRVPQVSEMANGET